MLRIICNSAKGNSTEEIIISDDGNLEEILAKIEELYAKIISIKLEFPKVESKKSNSYVALPETIEQRNDNTDKQENEVESQIEVPKVEENVDDNFTESKTLKTEGISTDRITENPTADSNEENITEVVEPEVIQLSNNVVSKGQRHDIRQAENLNGERGNAEAEILSLDVNTPIKGKANNSTKEDISILAKEKIDVKNKEKIFCDVKNATEKKLHFSYQLCEKKLLAEQIEFLNQYDLKEIKKIFNANPDLIDRMYKYLIMFGLKPGKTSFEVFVKAMELLGKETDVNVLAEKLAKSINFRKQKNVSLTQLKILLIHQYRMITSNQSNLKMIPFMKLVKIMAKEDIVVCTQN